jgi:TonB family protein
MRRFLFSICLLICLTNSAVSSAQQNDWKKFTVRDEEFSISLPAVPAMTTTERKLRGTSTEVTERVLGAYADGVAYAIFSFENKPERSLDSFIEEQSKITLFQWSPSGRTLSVDRVSGKEFDIPEAPLSGVVQFFSTATHLYQLQAIGAGAADPRVSRFLSSLKFGKASGATAVVDGPGTLPTSDLKTQGINLDRAFVARDVDRKALIVTRPEPSYTIDARRNAIAGEVVLRVVLSASGEVVNFRVLTGLPFGLSEQAIAAAKQIRFVPASKDGQRVSMWLQLEYNFSLH